MEHTSSKKGGPPGHLHHNEDQWFYVIEGQYIAEIGSQRVQLKPGDSILGPREIPHAWAFVGDTQGRMLIVFAPANQMEAFFRDNEKRRKDGDLRLLNPCVGILTVMAILCQITARIPSNLLAFIDLSYHRT